MRSSSKTELPRPPARRTTTAGFIFSTFAVVVLLLAAIACEAEPPPTIDVTLDQTESAFAIESKLTPEQASGNADVVISYGAITHWIKDGRVTRLPGRVIAWRDRQVEVLYPGQGGDEYIKVWVDYGEDYDTGKLHDNKENIASCRFEKVGNWPAFKQCSKLN